MCLVPFAAQFWTSNIQIAVQVAMSALGRSKSAPVQNLTGLSAAGPGASSPLDNDIGFDFVGRLLYERSVPSAVFVQTNSVGLLVLCGVEGEWWNEFHSAPSCFVPNLSEPSTKWCFEFHLAVRQTAATLFSNRAVVVCPKCSEDTRASQLLFAALVKTLSGLAVEDTLVAIGAWEGYFGSDEWKVH